MKAVSYLKSVPANNSNLQKTELLIKFISGVNRASDTGIIHEGTNILDANVAIIQGWVYDNITSPHLKLRKTVIDTQLSNNKYVVVADANLFLYKNKSNPHGYLRYSFNGIFPDTGIYCDDSIDKNRWVQLSTDNNIKLENYKLNGNHILIMLQRNGGWSMKGLSVYDWVNNTIKKIRNYSDRVIIIRSHPGDKRADEYLRNLKLLKHKNVQISKQGTDLVNDLTNAWAVINHNSSAIVGPIIQGYHAFVTDPQKSQCTEVANTDLSFLENPKQFDRQKWLERISMFHWKFDELENGTAWQHMRNYVRQ
jgi:hypothetical protein